MPTNEQEPRSRAELIRTAANSALRHVMDPGVRLPASEIQRIYGIEMVPNDLNGETASAVNTALHQAAAPLTEEQAKWFALGAAVQATATTELSGLGVIE